MWTVILVIFAIVLGRYWGKRSFYRIIPKMDLWDNEGEFIWTNLPPGGYYVLSQYKRNTGEHIIIVQYARPEGLPSEDLRVYSLPRAVPQIFAVRKVTRTRSTIDKDLFAKQVAVERV